MKLVGRVHSFFDFVLDVHDQTTPGTTFLRSSRELRFASETKVLPTLLAKPVIGENSGPK